MKNTLLTTTALVALTGAAAAEITVSGTGRIGIRTTEGAAAVAASAAVAGSLSAAQATMLELYDSSTVHGVSPGTASANAAFVAGAQSDANVALINAQLIATTALDTTADTAVTTATTALTLAINNNNHNSANITAARTTLATAVAAAAVTQANVDNMTEILNAAKGSAAGTATAAGADVTSAVNRFRISFKGSGETDSGIAYGISGRADQQNGSLGGTQFISGAFGKITMGDLGGADKDAAGHIAGGVGLSGMGSNNEIAYQAANHNLGYEFSTNGLTVGYSQNTAIQNGSNSAVGIKWAGDLGGTGVTVGLGQSKVGTSTQSTMSVAVSMSGLTIKGIQSTNDNGPANADVTGVTGAIGTRRVVGVDNSASNPDTDHTGFSISYAMDAMTVTAYSKTVSTLGAADQDFTGLGFTYDMGGATLKAGMVDDNNITSMDLGISFSF
jgi:outer membrane protein OmpU